MNILIVGGGGREHAITAVVAKSGVSIYGVMGNRNTGIIKLCKDFIQIKETEISKIVDYAKDKKIDIAIIGPESPLEHGIVDELQKAGISAVGPCKDAAIIETSKEFTRNLMEKHKIPGGAKYGVFDNINTIRDFVRNLNNNVVVKPIGLTGGKGVKVFGDQLKNEEEVIDYAKEVLENKIGGAPRVIVEEKLEGEEFTLQTFCDGSYVAPMPLVQDHKRAWEGDIGPNTGGMGSYTQENGLLPFLSKNDYDAGVTIVKKIVEAMKKDGREYRGILYGQFMLTKDGPKVIECNARFGDPEAMNVLSLLESDFMDACDGIINGTLHKKRVKFAKKATVCKYVVPKGYGVKSAADAEIAIDEKKIFETGAKLYYAAVNERAGRIYTTTSRSLGVVGVADNIEAAEMMAEDALKFVSGEIYVRHDIGKREYIGRKIRHMDEIRTK
ncbi:MAG: phosphoribosylamine--glycine ligase [Thermoplasmata archaeon]